MLDLSDRLGQHKSLALLPLLLQIRSQDLSPLVVYHYLLYKETPGWSNDAHTPGHCQMHGCAHLPRRSKGQYLASPASEWEAREAHWCLAFDTDDVSVISTAVPEEMAPCNTSEGL